MAAFAPGEKMLSKRFTLSDLTITDQKTPNVPDSEAIRSLTALALLLDLAYSQIGPFRIISAYRSQDTQNSLKNSGNNQAVEKSLHTLGKAADIAPTTMSAEKYMALILASPLRNSFGQIALKKTVLHVSLPVPAKNFVGTAMLVLADGKYYRQSDSWVQSLKDKYASAVKVATKSAEEVVKTAAANPGLSAAGVGALVVGAALIAAFSSGKKTA